MIAVDNHRNAGRIHWLVMPKVGPAARHIRDIEALTSDDLPLRMPSNCSIVTFPSLFVSQSKKGLTFRSQETRRSERTSSRKALSGCPSLFDPLRLSSRASTPHRTHHPARHCVSPSSPLACYYRAQDRFEILQISGLVSVHVDI